MFFPYLNISVCNCVFSNHNHNHNHNQQVKVTERPHSRPQEPSTPSGASASAQSRGRPRSQSTSSLESLLPVQSTHAHIFRTLSEETTQQRVVTFLKVPVRDDSPQSRSLSLSSTRSGEVSSPLFTPRRHQCLRSRCSDSEIDKEHATNKDDMEDSSSGEPKSDGTARQFRPRANATVGRIQRKRKSSSSTDSPSESPMVIGGHMPLVKKSSVQLKDEQISTLKVIIVGEPHTGKTSLLKSYIYKDFCFTYEETKGQDFHSCTVSFMDKDCRINFWDTAGQERFVHDRRKSLSRSFFKNSSAAFIVYDCCKPETLNRVPEWKEIIDFMVRQRNGDPIPVFVLANKCDMGHSDINVENFCQTFGFAGYFKCSAKKFDGMDKAVKAMVKKVLEQGPEVPKTCVVPVENVIVDYRYHSASSLTRGCCS
ncbi:uncharacterized protein [Dysidea avara]|uniref:uncharacterized protein n=1 Tax=Dysidea avara TaxID=196820 RepID=UPI00332D9E1D